MKVGDTVTRMLGGVVPMRLKITEITQNHIICGAWVFNKHTGNEVDEDLDSPVSHLIMDERMVS